MLTPAGQALVSAGLFTKAQLIALGAHPSQICVPDVTTSCVPVETDQPAMGGFRAFDLTMSWQGKFKERVTLAPSVGVYNLFNFANFDLPGNTLSGSLSGSSGSINGTHRDSRIDRVGVGTGVFGQGAPRVVEFGLKITF
jgi:hypothetical protein